MGIDRTKRLYCDIDIARVAQIDQATQHFMVHVPIWCNRRLGVVNELICGSQYSRSLRLLTDCGLYTLNIDIVLA